MSSFIPRPSAAKRSVPRLAVIAAALSVAGLLLPETAPAQGRVRTELNFPNLPGLITLRCDLHMHTVFSDGDVWPTVRVEEAWRTGLDAIALTDHIEYLPHKADLGTNYGRSYQLARAAAGPLGIIAIPAAEITRGEPPGHLNALFVTNVAALDQPDYRTALSNAFAQGAFLFWNHPGWKQPDKQSVWYPEQGEFLTNGWLRGIEIVNGVDYDPVAHQWCLEKNLTMLANSDIHDPIGFEYGSSPNELRPMTLVFATERSAEGIREALFARRAVVFAKGQLIGAPELLTPLFRESIEIINPEIRIRGKGRALVQIRNRAPVSFELRLNPKLPELDVPARLTLTAGKVSLLQVRCLSDRVTGEQEVRLPCRVLNLLVAPGKGLRTALPVRVKFEPAG